MPDTLLSSEYRVEKDRAAATLLLSSGQVVSGYFFMGDSAHSDGRERVGELLNGSTAFLTFERVDDDGRRIVLYNLAHIVMVTLGVNEAARVPGYEIARQHLVSLLLSNSQRIVGAVRVHLPQGHDRVSDWARDAVMFRYVETEDVTVIVNVQHVTEVTEVTDLAQVEAA